MNSTQDDSQRIDHFYGWIRDYLADLSRATDGELSKAINFGFWDAGCSNLFEAQMAFFNLVVKLLSPLEEGAHGAEVGCGIGGYAVRLLEQCPVQLTCYDLLDEHLSLTRQYAEEKGVADRLATVQGDSMNMGAFGDGDLDFLYSVESSFHYDEKQLFFNEVNRVLKQGGVFVYADFSCEDISRITFKDGNHFSSKAEHDAYIANAGLTIVEHMDIGDRMYEPLQKYTEYFNDELLQAPAGSQKTRVGKYWDLVLNNYTKLYSQGLMGYQIYKLRK